jgi:hypothetical protein
MKAIKRKQLEADEILRFNPANNFEIERYLNPLNIHFDHNTLNLWFDHSYESSPNSISIKAIYFDSSKNIEQYEPVEFIEAFEIPLPKEGIRKHNEFSLPIVFQENTKYLWKINFRIKPKIVCDLYISLA